MSFGTLQSLYMHKHMHYTPIQKENIFFKNHVMTPLMNCFNRTRAKASVSSDNKLFDDFQVLQ